MIEFIELTDENFDAVTSQEKVCLVDYYASWCGSCRIAAPMFLNVARDLNLPIFKVDAEKNPLARKKVSVPSLPTMALFRDGKAVGSVSATKREAITSFLAEHGIS